MLWGLFWVGNSSLQAGATTRTFVSPTNAWVAGARGGVSLFYMNTGTQAVQETFPSRIRAEFNWGNQKREVVLTSQNEYGGADKITLQPGSFGSREYWVNVPETIPVGSQVFLSISNYNSVLIQVEEKSMTPQIAPKEPSVALVDTNSPGAISRHFPKTVTRFSKYLTPYEPIYFLLGTYPASEFQFSLKYQLFDTTQRWLSPANDLFFGYTQTSFWDLFSKDPSFYDTSYKPSAFLYFQDIFDSRHLENLNLDFQTGYEHESNGRGGAGERSQNTAYIQPTLTFALPEDFQLSFSPRAWVYILGVSTNNPDVADYRGHADLVGSLTWRKNYQFTTKFTLGDHPDKSSIKFDFSFALPHSLGFTPRIHMQYFGGYGESFRQYNQTSHSWRMGISLFD